MSGHHNSHLLPMEVLAAVGSPWTAATVAAGHHQHLVPTLALGVAGHHLWQLILGPHHGCLKMAASVIQQCRQLRQAVALVVARHENRLMWSTEIMVVGHR
jgi:hypothetical protein